MLIFIFFFLMIRRPPRSTRTYHSFPTRRSSDLTAADQIRAARQDLERRDAAVGERAGEAGVLRPDAVLDPYFGGRRARRLIAVVVRGDAGGWIVAQVAVHVDDAGGQIFARVVAHPIGFGNRPIRSERSRVGKECT